MVRYKFIEQERTEDSPFVGALICADKCTLKCKGCFNKDLKKQPTLSKSAHQIINEVLSNPLNEGIILAGLEWSETIPDMLELCEEANLRNLKVIIYTGLSLGEFYAKVGEYAISTTKFKLPKDNLFIESMGNDINMYVGSTVLNNILTRDYYIKAGKYDATQKSVDNIQHDIKIASDNQIVYLIKGDN